MLGINLRTQKKLRYSLVANKIIASSEDEFMLSPTLENFMCWDPTHFYAIQIYFYEVYGVINTSIVFLYHTSIAGDLLTLQEGDIRETNEGEECSSHGQCNSGH